MIDNNKSINEVIKMLSGESNFSIHTKEQFNKCIDHIFQLITDAYALYNSSAFSSSVFLSITIIEEVGKVHMGMYIKPSAEYVKKDMLRDHKTKQVVGSNYTICMGERIKKAINADKLEEIFALAYSGKLKELREKAIYCEYKEEKLIVPNDIISKEFSKNILLFAIESFDDNLVGYTEHSMDISKKTDIIFEKVASV